MTPAAGGPGEGKGATGVRVPDNAVIGSTREVGGKNVRVGLLRGAVILASPLIALAGVFEEAETVEPEEVVEDIDEDELLRWALLLGTNILGRSSGIGEFRLFCEASPLGLSLLLRAGAAVAGCCWLEEGATAVMALETQNYQGSLPNNMSFDIVSSLISTTPSDSTLVVVGVNSDLAQHLCQQRIVAVVCRLFL